MSNSKCCEGSKEDFTISQLNGSISPVVEKCLSQIIEKEGFTYYNVNVKDISTNGGNYMATLQELELKGGSANGNKEISLFLKNRIDTADFKIFPLDEVYSREAFYYNELVKIYNKLQDDANIPEGDRYKMAESYSGSNADVTILDNLSKRGYTTYDRLEVISIEFAELSIKQLAKFHALSFALQANMPKFFDKKIKPINLLFNVGSEWKLFVETTFNAGLTYLDGESRRKMENFFPTMMESYKKYVDVSEDDAICLCHGDFRPNNIMVIEKDGKLKDLVVVDFQLINFGKPASDFIYFIFTGTDQKFRRAHLENLKEVYYGHFEKFLQYFGIYAEDVYPRKRFEDEYREHLTFGLTVGLMLIPFIFCNDDDIPDIHDITDMKFKWNERAKQRWREMAEDFIKWQNM